MQLSEDNCTGCFKYFGMKNLTVILLVEEQQEGWLCDNCLEKFKEKSKDQKVAVEVSRDGTLLYCYRCGLKTEDEEVFKKHDCIKTESSIKFVESLLKDGKND